MALRAGSCDFLLGLMPMRPLSILFCYGPLKSGDDNVPSLGNHTEDKFLFQTNGVKRLLFFPHFLPQLIDHLKAIGVEHFKNLQETFLTVIVYSCPIYYRKRKRKRKERHQNSPGKIFTFVISSLFYPRVWSCYSDQLKLCSLSHVREEHCSFLIGYHHH